MKLKNGQTTDDPRLGRIKEFDEKSRQYPIRELVANKSPRSYTWKVDHILDQGNEGACVGFGWTHELIAKPKPAINLHEPFALNLYHKAQTLDEWPGENYEGTSVLGGAKAVSSYGYMKEYRWAFDTNDGLVAIGQIGPAVIGIDWYEGMMQTDTDGFIHPTGNVVGGHCVCITGVSFKKKFVTGPNSWGSNWGMNGFWKMSFDDLDKLLKEQGEFCIPLIRELIK